MTFVPDPSEFGIDVKRYFYEGKTGQAPGTFFSLWDGHLSANHVLAQQNRQAPPFASPQIQSGEGVIDACLFGCNLAGEARPDEPELEQKVFVYGYPGGSQKMASRIGSVYWKRSEIPDGAGDYSIPTWVGLIDERPADIRPDTEEANYYEPVFIGMSGGLVMTEDGTPLGILVGRSGPSDVDFDGDLDQLFEFVALSDVWDVFESAPPTDAVPVHVRVDRVKSNHDVTISRVYVNDKLICHGLEDEYREHKVPQETRIPSGLYQLGVKRHGGLHSRYLTNFGEFHRGMLEVKNVPDFTDILIHVGNWDHETDGCLLVGRADYPAWAVWQSKIAYKRLYDVLIDGAIANVATIEFRDLDLSS